MLETRFNVSRLRPNHTPHSHRVVASPTLVQMSVRSLLVGAVLIVGCNTILDNKPGELRESKHGQLPAPGTGTVCGPSQHICHGDCVDRDDPSYGCGDPSCSPCA